MATIGSSSRVRHPDRARLVLRPARWHRRM